MDDDGGGCCLTDTAESPNSPQLSWCHVATCVSTDTHVQDPESLNAPFERTKLERDTFNFAQSSHFHVFNISYTSCCITQIFSTLDSRLLVFKYNRS